MTRRRDCTCEKTAPRLLADVRRHSLDQMEDGPVRRWCLACLNRQCTEARNTVTACKCADPTHHTHTA